MSSFLENATINCEIAWVQTDTINDTKIVDNGSVVFDYLYGSGTGIGEVNSVWYATGQVGLTGSSIDLFNLQRSIFGGTITTNMSGGTVKALVINNLNTGQNNRIH